MANITLKNIKKKYPNGCVAIDDLNLEIKDSEFVVLVGPSGSGKSTILRIISGLEEITSGEIFFDEKNVVNLSPKDRNVSMVFQNYTLYPHMNAYENIGFNLKIDKNNKINKKNLKDKILDIAQKLKITEILDRKPKDMSGGQRQRVALGKVIIREPLVFLFDEPLSNLDARLRASMRLEILKLHKELKESNKNATIIYVTHDQLEAMTMGDRICLLNNGKIEQFDTPANLYNNPKNIFVGGFIGNFPMNFIKGKITGEREIVFEFGNNRKLYIGKILEKEKLLKITNYYEKNVILGIRAEDIENLKYPVENRNTFEGAIDIVENLGDQLYKHFKIDGFDLVCRVDVKDMQSSNYFYFNVSKAIYFDCENGESIYENERKSSGNSES
ncbi:MAG: ABC transporter ATP-binding protein [Fusobacteriaceae bacterium]|nr:ABC transporter ATP-binding protein [Fusobacteriaceae bacterium]